MDEELKILIVDDDDVDRMAIRRALKSAAINASITEATSTREALEALGNENLIVHYSIICCLMAMVCHCYVIHVRQVLALQW